MFMRILEVGFTIGFVGLVLSNPTGFSSFVTTVGNVYSSTVKGLQPPNGQHG